MRRASARNFFNSFLVASTDVFAPEFGGKLGFAVLYWAAYKFVCLIAERVNLGEQ